MEDSRISWTHHTFNPWIGCTRVSRGCENCYAEAQNSYRRWNGGLWGPGAPRKVTSDENWKLPLRWNKTAEREGTRSRVFCASLADVFDPEAPQDARARLWALIRETPMLDWQILTKRPDRFVEYLPADWGMGYDNVWLGVSVDDRRSGYPRVEILKNTPARIRFLSCEPLLESIKDLDLSGIDWAIVGGESGGRQNVRSFELDWVREIKASCLLSGTQLFLKQLGSVPLEGGTPFVILNGLGKRDGHGTTVSNFPADLQIQQFPSRLVA